jgi:hypothetical protein
MLNDCYFSCVSSTLAFLLRFDICFSQVCLAVPSTHTVPLAAPPARLAVPVHFARSARSRRRPAPSVFFARPPTRSWMRCPACVLWGRFATPAGWAPPCSVPRVGCVPQQACRRCCRRVRSDQFVPRPAWLLACRVRGVNTAP